VVSGFADDPDALYADRENLASARRAAAIWAAVPPDAHAFDAAWKLARVCYWLGGHAPDNERKSFLEQGIRAGQKAVELQPKKPEGHFWIAANMGALAEASGMMTGLKSRGTIKRELETTRQIDPAFMEGSADRALGRWYFKVPSLFGGSDKKAEEYLRASLTYNQESTVSRYFLAELLVDEHRLPEARAELKRVVDAPFDADWAPEDRDYKAKATALLKELASKR
jgi:hypothetical protein